MATRKEQTGERSLQFSQWIRENLPDSQTGLCVTNIDFIFWNWKTKKLLIVEEKTHRAKLSIWFNRFMCEVIAPALSSFCEKNNIEFMGFHFIQFENSSPLDGKIFDNGNEISLEELKCLLSI